MSIFHPFGSGQYSLQSSISSTQNTISLSSFLEPVSGTPYTMALINSDIAFGTIAPKTSTSEFISFTGITQNADGTATLTGVTRGLQKKYPFTSSATFELPHSGQSIFIISNPPQLYEEYASIVNDVNISGLWNFVQTPTGLNPGAVPDASTTTKGITKMSVAPVSPTSPIAVGDNDTRVPTAGQAAALPGNNTDIAVGSGNKYVTQTGLQHNAEKYAADAQANDTYVITLSPAPTSYTNGMVVYFKANTANTGAATINVNGLGPKTIVKVVSTTLADNDIAAGQFCTLIYDGTNFVLQNPVANQPLTVAPTYANGVTTYDLSTASGTQNIAHGLASTPKSVEIFAMFHTTGASMVDSESQGGYDGTNNASIFKCSIFVGGASNTGTQGNDASNGVVIYQTATALQSAVITVSSSNIILTWTKTNSPTGTANLFWRANT